MISTIKKLMHHFSNDAYRQRHLKAMNDYLGQAVDRVHLEQLEREWFKKNGFR